MKSKEELEATAYGLWASVTSPGTHPMAVVMGHALLEFVLWQLDATESSLLDEGLRNAKIYLEQDKITDPIGVIKRDMVSRRDAQVKAMNAGNN